MNYRNWSYKIWVLIAVLLLICSVTTIYVYGTYFADPTQIPTEGTVQTSVSLLLASPSTIDWGTITVYGSTTKTVTLTNNSTESETIIDLSFHTANWLNTTELGLTLDWNYNGTDIYAKQDINVIFTLTSEAVPEDETITFFSFYIIITPIMQGDAS